jgi:hypothetical protein
MVSLSYPSSSMDGIANVLLFGVVRIDMALDVAHIS